jgi:thymidylate synthase
MLPYEKRVPDTQYRDILRMILERGELVKSQQGPSALRFIAPPSMRFSFSNGFPMITERSVKGFWKQPIGEICAFINGAQTLKELREFGCTFWEKWATPEKCAKRDLEPGDLGLGSYGHAFANFSTNSGEGFNQWQHVVEQIRELPHLRTHFISPWEPQYIGRGLGKKQRVVVAPCHGWVHILINEESRELTLHMFQRAADFPVGVPSNMVQYAALTMMVAHVTGYTPREFIHSFSDAHIYEDQLASVEEMLSQEREPRAFPTVSMSPRDNLFAFRSKDFSLSDYDPHPAIRDIPAAI